MYPYGIDVPVAIQAFIRPEMLAKQWEVIKKVRPSILFIRSDGPRDNVSTDRERVERSRAIVEEIDWECQVHRLYYEKNQGMYAIFELTGNYIWEHVDRCIFLEDDQIPSASFFRFCKEMLDRYENDLRINRITGVNICDVWNKTSSDYFFAKVSASSGVAIWKRSYQSVDATFKYAQDPHVMNIIRRDFPWYLKKQFVSFAETGTYGHHKAAGEFFTREAEFLQNQLIIVPKYNLISNIGIGDGSTHTGSSIKTLPHALRNQYQMKTYELDFPLKHPDYIMDDTFFDRERERQLGVRNRFQSISRLLERYFLLLIHGDFSKIKHGIKRVINKSTER